MKRSVKIFVLSFYLLSAFGFSAFASEPILIQEQGSFAVGGTTRTHEGTFSMNNFMSPEGQTAYGDHAYVFYQIPMDAKKFPIIFQHGGAQSKRTWETTPDGREGFQNIFLRRGFSVYLLDQPRRATAGASTEENTDNVLSHNPLFTDRMFYSLFRIGEWPEYYPGVQFDKKPGTLNQFMRQVTPDTGPFDIDVIVDALVHLLDKTGPSILITHSMGGTIGWHTPLRSDKVKAIVAYEPGGSPFIFPEGEAPEPIKTFFGPITPVTVPAEEFEKLTKMPIIIYYGDNIAENWTEDAGRDQWRGELAMARKFAETVNQHGGDASVVHLPEIGIKGNTHFIFSDLNNLEIADLLSKWLSEKGLD